MKPEEYRKLQEEQDKKHKDKSMKGAMHLRGKKKKPKKMHKERIHNLERHIRE